MKKAIWIIINILLTIISLPFTIIIGLLIGIVYFADITIETIWQR